jgi:hypothetical protein
MEVLTIALRTWTGLAGVSTLALLMLLASESAAAVTETPQGALLGSSRSIKTRVDAAERRRVLHSLAKLQFGPVTTVISPDELDNRLGANLTKTPASPENPLDEVEVETRVLPGVREQPLQSQIPFGLAAVTWGFRHPSQVWRLFLPVLPETGRALPHAYACEPLGAPPCWSVQYRREASSRECDKRGCPRLTTAVLFARSAAPQTSGASAPPSLRAAGFAPSSSSRRQLASAG